VAEGADLEATEEWFLARGLPHFIAKYSAGTDIWTRAFSALTLLVLVEIVVIAPRREFPIWLDLVVVAAAFAALVGGWAYVNRRRGRPPFQRPDDIGVVELAAFVLGPALVALIAGGQIRQALGVAIGNVLLLGVIYLSTSYGVFTILRWALGKLGRQVETVVSLLARALPMLALLVTFLFLTAEVWQTAGELVGPAYAITVLLFPLVGVMFLIVRLPRDIGALNNFDDVDVGELLMSTPMERASAARDDSAPPLGRREWGNVGLVALFSQGIQIFLVSMLIGLFFVLLGVLLVDEATTVEWAGTANVLATLTLGDRQLVVTEQLLRVAGFLTAFSGLNFTVYLLTDPAYRAEFREEVVGDLRQAFAVRAAYLRRLAAA
jgi:hypothetical protein